MNIKIIYNFLIVITTIMIALYIGLYGIPNPFLWIRRKYIYWRCEIIFKKLGKQSTTEEEKVQWKEAETLVKKIRQDEKLFEDINPEDKIF